MSDIPSEIFDLEEEIAAELAGKSFFSGPGIVPITDRSEELQNRIDQTVAKFGGLIIGITCKGGTLSQPNVFRTLRFDPLRLTVVIGEKVQLNRSPTGTGVQGDLAMMAVMQILHGYCPPSAGRMLVVREFGRVQSSQKGMHEWAVDLDTAVTLPSLANLTE